MLKIKLKGSFVSLVKALWEHPDVDLSEADTLYTVKDVYDSLIATHGDFGLTLYRMVKGNLYAKLKDGTEFSSHADCGEALTYFAKTGQIPNHADYNSVLQTAAAVRLLVKDIRTHLEGGDGWSGAFDVDSPDDAAVDIASETLKPGVHPKPMMSVASDDTDFGEEDTSEDAPEAEPHPHKDKAIIMDTPGQVPLCKATKLYEPVRGTDATSRYFCVGLSSELAIAARIRDCKVSIRVERRGSIKKAFTSAQSSALVAAGLTPHGDYASIHMSDKDPAILVRAVGAVLTGIPELTTPMPDLKGLVGAGI